MKAEVFEDLEVWQLGRELVKRIYGLVGHSSFYADYALRTQITKASISVPSNTAEGYERGSDADFIRFLYYAKGSAGEVRSQLYHALDQGYIQESEFEETRSFCITLSKKLGSFIGYLEKTMRKKR